MSDNKLFKALLTGTLSLSTLTPNLLAEAKPSESSINIAVEQQEPTLGQDLNRYGKKFKRTIKDGAGNIKERWQDHKQWEAEKCRRTNSTTQRCQKLRREFGR